ncbi:MAG: HEPN domain-containing protein [Cyanobacteria bacterium J06634_5]
MKPTTQEWVDKAEGDFSVAQLLAAQKKPSCDHICFLSQQCVEKYLKACLQEADIFFPKTHLLPALMDLLLPTAPGWEDLQPQLKSLSAYAVDYRYPGATATIELADEALQDCTSARAVIRQHLGLEDEKRIEAEVRETKQE